MEIEELNKNGLIHFSSFMKYQNENNKSSFYPFTSLNNIKLFNKLDDFYIYEYNLKSKKFLPKVLKDVKIAHEFYNEVAPDLPSNNTRLAQKKELGIIFIDMYFNYIIKYQKVIIYINGNDEELSSLFFFLNRYNSSLQSGISGLVSLLKKYDFNDLENISNYLTYITPEWNDNIKIISLKKRYKNLIEYNNFIKLILKNKTNLSNLLNKHKRLKHSYNNLLGNQDIQINDIKYQKELFIDKVKEKLTHLNTKIIYIEEECKHLEKINSSVNTIKCRTCIMILPIYLFVMFTLLFSLLIFKDEILNIEL
jgi:hypothetical protein